MARGVAYTIHPVNGKQEYEWKVRAVGQGYDNGLAGIATAFGVNIDDEPEAPPPAPTLPPSAAVRPLCFPFFRCSGWLGRPFFLLGRHWFG